MSDHFDKFADYILGEDNSEIAKVEAERDYALHCLEREIGIAENARTQNAALVKALEVIAHMTPATSDITVSHMMGQIAEEALASFQRES